MGSVWEQRIAHSILVPTLPVFEVKILFLVCMKFDRILI